MSCRHSRLIPLQWADLDKLPERSPLIDGVIDQGGFSVIYGASNSGKTFFSIDLGARVALGKQWRGRQVHQTGVLLISPDAGIGLRERLNAWAVHANVETIGVPLYVIAEPINLCQDARDVRTLIKHLRDFNADIGLVIVDTLSRALAGGDENGARDMGLFVNRCDDLRTATGAHVMAIHHTGKDDGRGARGHSLLRAATDTEIEIADRATCKTAKITKQRDHPGGDVFPFQIIPTGNSCVAVESTEEPAQPCRRVNLSNKAKIALDSLKEAIATAGEIPAASTGIPRNTPTVDESAWRSIAIARGISDSDQIKVQNQAFKRAAEQLQVKRQIGRWRGQCWVS